MWDMDHSKTWRRLLVGATALVIASAGQARSDDLETADLGAADKVRATMQVAVEDAPLIALQLSQLGAEVATVRSQSGAGAPILTWQSEGIGGGFQRNLNATDFVRMSLPFNKPWHIGTNRDLREAAGRWLESGQRVTALEVAGLAGRRWIDLAAATARQRLAEARLERLGKALTIQQRRFDLGEISGSERHQVELEHTQETAMLRQAEALRLAVQRELELLAPGGFPGPLADDLQSLVEGTATPADLPAQDLVEAGPALQFAVTRAEVAQLEAKRQRGTAYGFPEVEVEWERVPDLGVIEGFDGFGFRLSFPLPVGRQGRQQVVASEESARAATAEQELIEQRLLARFRTALETARGAESALEALEPSIASVPAIERSLSEQFRLGAISYLVYLDGFSRLDEMIQSAIEARHALLVARLDIAEIMGTDIYFPLPEIESGGES